MPAPRLQILVCTNQRSTDSERPSCGARCSLELYRALKDLVRDRDLRDELLISRTGCLRHCSRGPTVVIWPGNFWHGHVGVEDAGDLLDAALAGQGLDSRPMPAGPWE